MNVSEFIDNLLEIENKCRFKDLDILFYDSEREVDLDIDSIVLDGFTSGNSEEIAYASLSVNLKKAPKLKGIGCACDNDPCTCLDDENNEYHAKKSIKYYEEIKNSILDKLEILSER
jgi:hypothetical protein